MSLFMTSANTSPMGEVESDYTDSGEGKLETDLFQVAKLNNRETCERKLK